jgi:hypothetical protein
MLKYLRIAVTAVSLTACGFLIAAVSACSQAGAVGDGPVPARNEIVMTPGMRITAATRSGKIAITAGQGLQRSYSWEGATRSVEMWPRNKRWYGSLGLYYPGPGDHWKEHYGITRGVVEEGQQRFQTEKEAADWIEERQKLQRMMSYVWRRDGLVVGWGKVAERKQLNVEVWQVYIDGKKPSDLPNSTDQKIKVEIINQKP